MHLGLLTKCCPWAVGNHGVSVLVHFGWRGCEPADTRKTAAKPWEIEDGLWARIERLLPVVSRSHQHPGGKRLDSRKVLCGILFCTPGSRGSSCRRSWVSVRG